MRMIGKALRLTRLKVNGPEMIEKQERVEVCPRVCRKRAADAHAIAFRSFYRRHDAANRSRSSRF
jgi:hypothetical protein